MKEKKKEKNFFENTLNIVVIAIIIVLIILTFGWFVRRKKIEEEQVELETKIKHVQERVTILRAIKDKLERRKRIRFFLVRIIIGILFLGGDYVFLKITVKTYDLLTILNNLLTINGIVLMVYSFIAFITFGTVTNFITVLKSKYVYFLEKKHFDSFEELLTKEKELAQLQDELRKKEKEKEDLDKEKNDVITKISEAIEDETQHAKDEKEEDSEGNKSE